MCGIVGIQANRPVSYLIHSALIALQHRGQDATGIVSEHEGRFNFKRGAGLVKNVYNHDDLANLEGNRAIAHVRYPTSGKHDSLNEIQPLYVNSPFGIALGHNGNIVNTEELKAKLRLDVRRHHNTDSDTEVILNFLAYQLQRYCKLPTLSPDDLAWAVENLFREAKGAFSVVALIAGKGMFAFRDPKGIRPLILGSRVDEDGRHEYMVSSESVAISLLGFSIVRDVNPGELLFIPNQGEPMSSMFKGASKPHPCLFEYVYLARPDSIIDGISVYSARMEMGVALAHVVQREIPPDQIDVVIPIPDTSRIAAFELAKVIGKDYREGFIKNRYIDRTFIMPKQIGREIAIKHKLNPVHQEFQDKNVLLVDDSIVRGTTSKEIAQMAKQAGAKKVFFAVASPPVSFSNYYGIDIPTKDELIASNLNNEDIARKIGCEKVVYLPLDDITNALRKLHSGIEKFEDSCFSGKYIHEEFTDYSQEEYSLFTNTP